MDAWIEFTDKRTGTRYLVRVSSVQYVCQDLDAVWLQCDAIYKGGFYVEESFETIKSQLMLAQYAGPQRVQPAGVSQPSDRGDSEVDLVEKGGGVDKRDTNAQDNDAPAQVRGPDEGSSSGRSRGSKITWE